MSVRLAVAVSIGAAVIVSYGQPAAAQADAHARAIARASCQSGKHSDAVIDAKAAVARTPDDLGPRMRLADALVDQGCYQEAVEILEAAQEGFPHSAELAGKLRDTRSLVTEQTYIEGLTQAAESARIARSQLRCTKLADITACDDALHFKPDDVPLLLARGDALMQADRPAEALTAYRHVAQLKPADETLKSKVASAEALVAKSQPSPGAQAPGVGAGAAGAAGTPTVANSAARVKAPRKDASAGAVNRLAAAAKPTSGPHPDGGQHLTATPTAAIAALAPEAKTYSNDAPPGQTN
ncbi:MAG: tetratricopeptide repeat protein [Proteobacteria bacterium]|nr:tetratricopeptide repeat protein [Pseudomonadota bacterium]